MYIVFFKLCKVRSNVWLSRVTNSHDMLSGLVPKLVSQVSLDYALHDQAFGLWNLTILLHKMYSWENFVILWKYAPSLWTEGFYDTKTTHRYQYKVCSLVTLCCGMPWKSTNVHMYFNSKLFRCIAWSVALQEKWRFVHPHVSVVEKSILAVLAMGTRGNLQVWCKWCTWGVWRCTHLSSPSSV